MNQYNGFGVYPDWKNVGPIKKMDITEYTSDIEHTINQSIIIASFPAESQVHTGVYDLIVVAKIYDPGYKNNARTVTIDYSNVFELVSNSEDSDVDDPVQIEINNASDETPKQDYYVVAGSYNNNEILLRRNDNATVHVDINPVSGWYEGD